MNRYSRLIAATLSSAALLLSAPALAQAEPEVPTEEHASHPIPHPALWKVADEDTTIYLFGTVHALPPGLDWYRGPIAQALDGSDQLVTEIITDESTVLKMQELVLAKGLLPPDRTLRGLLNDEQRTAFEAGLAKLGIPAAAFDRFEPWYASMMFTMLPLMKEGYSPQQGVEFTLGEKAGEGKARGELETVEWQIAMFDELPEERQIGYMMETIAQVDEIKPMLDRMVAEWLEGDADALAALMNESMTDSDLAEILLYSRNRSWAGWIDTRLDTPGTVFIAVGAGHLAGNRSVQDALAERGIETTRVQ